MGDYPHTQSVTYNGVGGKQVEGLKVRLGLGVIYHTPLILTQGEKVIHSKLLWFIQNILPTDFYRVSKHNLLQNKTYIGCLHVWIAMCAGARWVHGVFISFIARYTCVSSRHSRKCVTLLNLMTELIFFKTSWTPIFGLFFFSSLIHIFGQFFLKNF